MGISVVSVLIRLIGNMTAVGFEPTQLALVELESTPLDHSGKLSMYIILRIHFQAPWCMAPPQLPQGHHQLDGLRLALRICVEVWPQPGFDPASGMCSTFIMSSGPDPRLYQHWHADG